MSAIAFPAQTESIEWSPKFYLAEALFLAFNALDAIFTILYVGVGVATESNPLLAAAMAISPVLFVTVKMALAILAVAILHTLRRTPAAQHVMVFGAVAYACVIAWHLAHLQIGIPVAVAML